MRSAELAEALPVSASPVYSSNQQQHAAAAAAQTPSPPEAAAGLQTISRDYETGPSSPAAAPAVASESAEAAAKRSIGKGHSSRGGVGGVERVDAFGRRRRFFSLDEIALHTARDDCWLVAHGKVFDVTAFLSHHPAGDLAILRKAATDTTIDYDFHSGRAQRMWQQYFLGYIDPGPGRAGTGCTLS